MHSKMAAGAPITERILLNTTGTPYARHAPGHQGRTRCRRGSEDDLSGLDIAKTSKGRKRLRYAGGIEDNAVHKVKTRATPFT